MKYPRRIHITGASWYGVTTLGKALSAAIGAKHLDTDDFYWRQRALPTPPEDLVSGVLASAAACSFDVPRKLASVMMGFPAPWYIAGGWAIDVFLGTKTRPHADIEILVFREDQLTLQRHLHAFDLTKIIPGDGGGVEQRWLAGEVLDPFIHQMRARSAAFEFDIFLADTDGDQWVYRRDPRVIHPRHEIGDTTSSLKVPFLTPEIVLLFKAKYMLPKDNADFKLVVTKLGESEKRWLADALRCAHPGCPWIVEL